VRVRFDAGGRRWVLRWEGGGLDVELGADGLARPAGVPAGPMVEAEGRPVAWALAGWRRDGAALEVTLAAAGLPLEAVARLAVAAGVVAWRTTLRHRGGAAVAVTAARSALVAMPGPVARIHTLTGAWALETQPHVLPAAQAPLVLGSRSGRTGFAFQPWVALEGAQEWLLCELLWSGNWRLELRPDDDGMAVLAGLEPAGFCHVLADGAVLALPELLLARADGLGAATRRLHDARRRLRPDPDRAVPVQFNTWFPFPGEPEATRLLEVVPLAARLGCEAFVLDAGWSTTPAPSRMGWGRWPRPAGRMAWRSGCGSSRRRWGRPRRSGGRIPNGCTIPVAGRRRPRHGRCCIWGFPRRAPMPWTPWHESCAPPGRAG